MKKVSRCLTAGFLAAVCLTQSLPATAAISDFVGKWRNADPVTRGITNLKIFAPPNQITVHAWGACQPNLCDMGLQPAQVFTPNVGVPPGPGMDAAIVEFDQSGIQTMLLLQKSGDGLSYKSFTIFTDGSGRSNYHDSGHFVRF